MSEAEGLRLRERGVAAAAAGQEAAARAAFEAAVAAAPDNGSILNSAAHFFSRRDSGRAIELARRACRADPSNSDYRLNAAIIAIADQRPSEALELLDGWPDKAERSARYWSVLGQAQRGSGKPGEAHRSFGRALAQSPATVRYRHGLARTALEAGLPAVDHYRELTRLAPQDPHAWLGQAQAMEAEDDPSGAREVAEQIVAAAPTFVDGLEFLAGLRWAAGEGERFADHYPAAARLAPDEGLFESWCRVLQGVDMSDAALDAAERGCAALPQSRRLALRRAIHAGEAGRDALAEAAFADLDEESPDRWLAEARHRLRRGEPQAAEALLERVLDGNAEDIAAWALIDIAWRMTGNPRHEWLHGQAGLVARHKLKFSEDEFQQVIRFLDGLHDRSASPIGQSVRSGSQTRGGLFARPEPEAQLVEKRFRDAIEEHRQALPPADPRHPLLRHRDCPWSFAGSWSIRLNGSGGHIAHLHPEGLISSAAYFLVPDADGADSQAGWLELGRPPADLRLDLPPIATVEPLAGHCVLFPSSLYHGTRPIRQGRRMTVAVDVNLRR